MAEVKFNLKDANLTKGIDAVAIATGWTEKIVDAEGKEVDNISKEQNFKRWLKAKIRNEIVEQANREALNAVAKIDEDL